MKVNLVAVAKNEARYIQEWLNYHQKLGFNEIIVYDNSGNGDLKSHDNITVYDAPGERIQLQAYQDSLSKMTYGQWNLYLDIDEFLNIGNLSVQEFLKPYQGADVVKLNWVVYGDNEQLEYEDKPVRERFLKPAPLSCVYNDTVKVPENCHTKYFYCHKYKQTMLDIHTAHVEGGIVINTKGQRVQDSQFQELCLDRGFIQHYITKSTREFCERRLNTKDACGNVVADFDSLKRFYFNLNTYSKEKEDIFESYRPNKNLGTVSSEFHRELLQPLAESEGPKSNSKRTNKSNKRVCGGK